MGYLKKILAMGQFNIVGHNTKGGFDIVYIVDTQDEELKQKITDNKLDGTERNFLVSSIAEYFEANVATDRNLFNCGIGNFIIPEIDGKTIEEIQSGKFDFPAELININWLASSKAVKSTKNKETGERTVQFSKNYYNKLDPAEKLNIVTDVAAFFDAVWGEDYLDRRIDINNFVVLSDGDQSNFVTDKDVASNDSPFRKKLASMLKL